MSGQILQAIGTDPLTGKTYDANDPRFTAAVDPPDRVAFDRRG